MREYEITEIKGYLVKASSKTEAFDRFWAGLSDAESDWDIQIRELGVDE